MTTTEIRTAISAANERPDTDAAPIVVDTGEGLRIERPNRRPCRRWRETTSLARGARNRSEISDLTQPIHPEQMHSGGSRP
jgi:hypothetical protein